VSGRVPPDYAAAMSLAARVANRAILTAALGGVLALAGCGSGSGSPTSGSARPVAAAAAARAARLHGGCVATPAPTPKGPQHLPRPSLTLDPARSYVVDLATNCGSIDIRLAVREAPRTTASFAYLVGRGFYDDLTFHRVAAGFVIQGGDPNGDGSGGPGYTLVERPPRDLQYKLGTVAMAKTASDPAGASGSQFFIVTAARVPLPPQYALVGEVVGGMRAVEAISHLPTDPPQDGAPTEPVVIDRATLHIG
jgi:peptidyl-prolyl cis-trans isomerase B (cyclophilin B)